MPAMLQLEGVDRLAKTLGDAARAVADLRTANVSAMRLLTTRGRATAPHRSGALAGAVKGDVEKQGARNYVVVSNAKAYAKRTHWGFAGPDSLGRHFSQAGQPWLLRTGRQYRRQVLKEYRAATVAAVKKVKGA